MFDQRAFARDLAGHGLDDAGVVYVPTACRDRARLPRPRRLPRLQPAALAKIGDAFVKDSGFADWADTNRLIVLFPQVRAEHVQSARLLGLVGLHGRATISRATARRSPPCKRMLDRLARPPGSN